MPRAIDATDLPFNDARFDTRGGPHEGHRRIGHTLHHLACDRDSRIQMATRSAARDQDR
jgi:hypothetical protein